MQKYQFENNIQGLMGLVELQPHLKNSVDDSIAAIINKRIRINKALESVNLTEELI